MARVTGIGGIFFRARDPQAQAAWYERHLGIDDLNRAVWRQDAGPTIYGPFAEATEYFGRREQQWMVNFRVDDLDALIEQLEEKGVTILKRDDNDGNGRFAWVLDPDGNNIELWEPRGPL